MMMSSVGILRSAKPGADLALFTLETNGHAAGCALPSLTFRSGVGIASGPAEYFKEAFFLHFGRSMKHGFLVLFGRMDYVLAEAGMKKFALLNREGRKLVNNAETKR
ncbi:MAG: hypothetical protein ABR903_05495 [Thermodesulfovibrionales bacterium]|jgi:hypothetical protein